jgi:hypothetical protein
LPVEGKSFAVDLSQGFALLLIGHDDKVPQLAVAPGGRLYGKFQALLDELGFYRS